MSNDNGHDAEAAYFAKLDQENKQKLSAQLGAEREQADLELFAREHARAQ